MAPTYRIVQDVTTRAWIVEQETARSETWKDVATFREHADARRYVQQVLAKKSRRPAPAKRGRQ